MGGVFFEYAAQFPSIFSLKQFIYAFPLPHAANIMGRFTAISQKVSVVNRC